jgi:hypothetical protein
VKESEISGSDESELILYAFRYKTKGEGKGEREKEEEKVKEKALPVLRKSKRVGRPLKKARGLKTTL